MLKGKNKMITEKSEELTIKAPLQRYTFPKEGVVVEARDIREAEKKLQAILKKDKK